MKIKPQRESTLKKGQLHEVDGIVVDAVADKLNKISGVVVRCKGDMSNGFFMPEEHVEKFAKTLLLAKEEISQL